MKYTDFKNMNCSNCIRHKRVKKLTNGKWEWFYICNLFENDESDGTEGFCLYLGNEDDIKHNCCEEFLNKEMLRRYQEN